MVGYMSLEEQVDKDFAVARTFDGAPRNRLDSCTR